MFRSMAAGVLQAVSSSSSSVVCQSDTSSSPPWEPFLQRVGSRFFAIYSLPSGQRSSSTCNSVTCRCCLRPNGTSISVANKVKLLGGPSTKHMEALSRQFQGLLPAEKMDDPINLRMKIPSESLEGCHRCANRGAVQCLTCTGSGLYVDSILESQGIIVHVRCLGCGGSGEIMCPRCGGRGRI